jgi:WhiB family redox-sensing transcriptional regulator
MAIRAQTPSPDWSDKHWRGEAKCTRTPPSLGGPDLFYDDEPVALEFCNGTLYPGDFVCPRRAECLRTAMLNLENYGIWGGMTPEDRFALRSRYPGMPERWVWHPPRTTNQLEDESSWPTAA